MNAGEFTQQLKTLLIGASVDPAFQVAASELLQQLQAIPDEPMNAVSAALARALAPRVAAARKQAQSEAKRAQAQRKRLEAQQKARAREAERQHKAALKQAAAEQKRLERERQAALKQAAAEQKRLEKERKAAEKKAAEQARLATAPAQELETGFREYCDLRDLVATLSVSEIRTRFQTIRGLSKPALEAIAARLSYPFKGSARKIADELLDTLERLKVNEISAQSIREKQ